MVGNGEGALPFSGALLDLLHVGVPSRDGLGTIHSLGTSAAEVEAWAPRGSAAAMDSSCFCL